MLKFLKKKRKKKKIQERKFLVLDGMHNWSRKFRKDNKKNFLQLDRRDYLVHWIEQFNDLVYEKRDLGTGFYPIITHINKLIEEKKLISSLNSLKNRLAYFIIIDEKIKHILLKYDWDKLKSIELYCLNLIETYISTAIHLIEISLKITHAKVNGLNQLEEFKGGFSEFFKEFFSKYGPYGTFDDGGVFINSSIDFTIWLYLRNLVIHKDTKLIQRLNGKFVIKLDNIPHKRRYGEFSNWIEDAVKLARQRGIKFPYDREFSLIDPRFTYLTIKGYITSKGVFDRDQTNVTYNRKLEVFIKKTSNSMFLYLDHILSNARGIKSRLALI